MTRLPLLALALLALSACASRGPMDLRDPGVRSEKEIIVALSKIEASAEQRAAVLAAFDAALPQLKAMQAERETLQAQLQRLSPKQPDYLERSTALAQLWGDLKRREIETYARFESAVATSLSDRQWEQWQDYGYEARLARRGPVEGGGGEMRRRR